MKKIIATVLMFTMLLASFAACNNDSDESSAPAGSRTESTTSDAVSADLSSGEEVSEGFPLDQRNLMPIPINASDQTAISNGYPRFGSSTRRQTGV